MNLYPHQTANASKLVRSLNRDGAAIDASDTGTGKSFTAFAVAAALQRRPFIICPLGVGPSWNNKSKTPLSRDTTIGSVVGSSDGVEWVNYEKSRRSNFRWPEDMSDSLVIVDEAHRVGSPDSLQAKMVRRLVDRGLPVLFLSATPFATPMRTRAMLHACNKVHWDDWYGSLKNFGCYRHQRIKGKPWMWDQSESSIQHLKLLLENNMVATRWSEVDGFPDVLVQPEVVHVAEKAKAEALARAVSSNPLGQTVKERQVLEGLRVPAMVEMTKDLTAQGKKVLAFFNFTEPLREFANATLSLVIDGSTPKDERQRAHNYFQSGRTNILALNSKAGGEGIDLQGRDRVSLISPDWSAVTYKQVFGRTHRIGGERAILKPIFIGGTIEETKVMPTVMRNSQNIEALTDMDLR